MSPNVSRRTFGLVVGLALLAALAAGLFVSFYSINGTVFGRDAGFHVVVFYDALERSDSVAGFLTVLGEAGDSKHGPALWLLTIPFWAAFGSLPSTFGMVNLAVFFAVVTVTAVMLKRLGADSAWALMAGVVFLFGPLGLNLFLLYNIDALTVLAAWAGYLALVVDCDRNRGRWAVLFAVLGAALFVRPNTLFFLIGPAIWFAVRSIRPLREGAASIRNRRGDRAMRAIAAILWAIVLWHYIPDVFRLPTYLKTSPNFEAWDETIATGLWTWKNWTWFFVHAADPFPWLWAVASVPLAVRGTVKYLPGRRLATALFALVPLVVYSFILGTRKVEYLAPTYLMWQFLAVLGLHGLKNAVLKWALVALLFFSCLGYVWADPFGLRPVPFLSKEANERLVGRVDVATLEHAPREHLVGTYPLARRALNVLFPDANVLTVGVVSLDPLYGAGEAIALFRPLFEDADADLNVLPFDDPASVPGRALDAVIVLAGRDSPIDIARPGARYRAVDAIPLSDYLSAHLLLPANSSFKSEDLR